MNVPISPPVDLRNLANLESADISRALVVRKRSKKPVAALGLGVLAATGVLAWRAAEARLARRSRVRGLLIAGGVGLAALAVARWQLQRLFAPQPKYSVELRENHFEVRTYPSLRTADTDVDASWDAALDEGFRRLARFIFGGNDAQKMIAMTAPVLGTTGEAGYRVSFLLPEGMDLPNPNDDRVDLRDVPARRVGVIRFHGRHNAYNLALHKRDLARALATHGLKPLGETMFAGYDPPTTIPLLRRNELWVELA